MKNNWLYGQKIRLLDYMVALFIFLGNFHTVPYTYSSGFPGGSGGVAGDAGLILGSGRSPGGGNSNPRSFLAETTPWTEETGSLQFMGSQRVGHELSTHTWHSAFHNDCARETFYHMFKKKRT